MKLSQLLNKYNLTEDDLNFLTTSMMEGQSLVKASALLNGKLSPEQVFAVCKWYCQHEFNLPIDEMSPSMTLERMDMQVSKRSDIIRKIEFNKEVKRLKGIEEDLRFLEAEMRLKSVA